MDTKLILIVGYGNPSRSDDSVGFYVIDMLNQILGLPRQELVVNLCDFEAVNTNGGNVDTLFLQQLVPELIELIIHYRYVVFIDATTHQNEDVFLENIHPQFSISPFSHSLTPAALLHLAYEIHNKSPQGYFISIPGKNFQFGTKLSPETIESAEIVIGKILHFIESHY